MEPILIMILDSEYQSEAKRTAAKRNDTSFKSVVSKLKIGKLSKTLCLFVVENKELEGHDWPIVS